jgi:hypothetical protein
MEAKMNELRTKLGVAPSQSIVPAPVMAPVTIERKKEEPMHEFVHEDNLEPKPVS